MADTDFVLTDRNVEGKCRLKWNHEVIDSAEAILFLRPEGWMYLDSLEWLESQLDLIEKAGWLRVIWSFQDMPTTRYTAELVALSKFHTRLAKSGGWVGVSDFPLSVEGTLELLGLVGFRIFVEKSGLRFLD